MADCRGYRRGTNAKHDFTIGSTPNLDHLENPLVVRNELVRRKFDVHYDELAGRQRVRLTSEARQIRWIVNEHGDRDTMVGQEQATRVPNIVDYLPQKRETHWIVLDVPHDENFQSELKVPRQPPQLSERLRDSVSEIHYGEPEVLKKGGGFDVGPCEHRVLEPSVRLYYVGESANDPPERPTVYVLGHHCLRHHGSRNRSSLTGRAGA
ncbi:MAG: hypothetical protein ACOCZB_01475 [Spirochaetota bacterium]